MAQAGLTASPHLVCYIISALCLLQGFCEVCPEGEPVDEFDIDHEADPGVFDALTSSEIGRVYRYMLEESGLDIVSSDQVTLNSTYVYLIDRQSPLKADVLHFLDRGGPKPDRYARVIVFRGSSNPPVVEAYKVGPLPSATSHQRVQLSGSDTVDYIRRSYFAPADYVAFEAKVKTEVVKVDHILKRVTGYSIGPDCGATCLLWLPGMPGEFKPGTRSMWIYLLRNEDNFYLHPVGLQFRINCGEYLDPDEWTVNFAWFRGSTYSNLDAMAESYQVPDNPNPTIYTGVENLYSRLDHRGDPLPEKKQRGPRSFMPDGRRYKVRGHHVDWQGWSFDFSIRSIMGLQVHDVQFKGERVVYDIGMSELGIVYTGASPSPQHSTFIDSTFYIGLESFELVPGVDCPDHATFFDFAHFFMFKPFVFKNSACVFELDRGVPLRRHTDSDFVGGYRWKQGMPGNVLVLRAVVTVYNYEYILDYVFHQNGAIEVVLSLSGFILSSYYTGQPKDDRYGFQVAPQTMGQIHNHMSHFKVDLDILGQQNRFETLDIQMEDIDDPAEPSERIKVQKFERNLRRTELNGAYQYNFDTPKYLIFHNNKTMNGYGNVRGYRLLPVNVNKQLLPRGWTVENGLSWARYQVAVTQYKDSEERASSMWNLADNVDPQVNFQDFIDDDQSIIDEDLVAWVTMGAFHIPHSEDIPIVQTPGLSLTFYLLPFNFFDEDPSLASRDNIRVTPAADGSDQFSYVGVSPEMTCEPRVTSGVSWQRGCVVWLLWLSAAVLLLAK